MLAVLSGNAWIGWQILQRMPPTVAEIQRAPMADRQKMMARQPLVTVNGTVEVSNEPSTVEVTGKVDVGKIDDTVTVSEIQAPVQVERAR